MLHLRIAYFKLPFDPLLYRWLHLRRIGRSLHCRMHKNTLALTVCALVATFFLPKASRMYTNGVDILSSYDLA